MCSSYRYGFILGNVRFCLKKKKKGTHGSPVSSWQALRTRGSVSALQQKAQMFDNVWRGSNATLSACTAAFTTYLGASCSDAYGPLWSCRPAIASGALKSGRPWREVYLTLAITFCLCFTLPSLLQGQQVRLILWLQGGPAHSTQIRIFWKKNATSLKCHLSLRQVPVGLWVPLHPTTKPWSHEQGWCHAWASLSEPVFAFLVWFQHQHTRISTGFRLFRLFYLEVKTAQDPSYLVLCCWLLWGLSFILWRLSLIFSVELQTVTHLFLKI